METVFGVIYCWFETFFGQNLAEHLWGFDGSEYTKTNIYNSVGVVMLLVSLFLVLSYYYFLNHPRFNKWWNWLIILGLNGIVNLLIGYAWTVNDYLNGTIADNLMYSRNEEGEIVTHLITSSDCWGFGMANFFVATMFFTLFSFCFKWWSRNCKHSPCL